MGDKSGCREKYFRSSSANIDENFSRRLERKLSKVIEVLQNMHEEISTRENSITYGNYDVSSALSEAMNRGLLLNLSEEHDRPSLEDMGSTAICADAGTNPKLPLSSATTRSSTHRHVGVQSGGISQCDFTDDSEKHLKRENMEKELHAKIIPPFHTTAELKHKCLGLRFIGWIREKPCVVTVDTGASSTLVRPDVAEGLPERYPTKVTKLRTITGQRIPVIKEVLVKLTLHKCRIITWAIVANINEEFLLGLDVMCAEDVILDLQRHVLRIGGQEVPLKHF
jgi:predicted aspartyl protease